MLKITREYNKLLKSINKKRIYEIPYMVKYLNKRRLSNINIKNYLITNLPLGIKVYFFIHENALYKVKNDNISFLRDIKTNKLNNTILGGYISLNDIIITDVLVIKNINIRSKCLKVRIKFLKYISEQLNFKYSTYSNSSVDIVKYNSILLVPLNSNYSNNKTYIFTKLDKIKFNF